MAAYFTNESLRDTMQYVASLAQWIPFSRSMYTCKMLVIFNESINNCTNAVQELYVKRNFKGAIICDAEGPSML